MYSWGKRDHNMMVCRLNGSLGELCLVHVAHPFAERPINLTLDRLHVTSVDRFWQAALNASKVHAPLAFCYFVQLYATLQLFKARIFISVNGGPRSAGF